MSNTTCLAHTENYWHWAVSSYLNGGCGVRGLENLLVAQIFGALSNVHTLVLITSAQSTILKGNVIVTYVQVSPRLWIILTYGMNKYGFSISLSVQNTGTTYQKNHGCVESAFVDPDKTFDGWSSFEQFPTKKSNIYYLTFVRIDLMWSRFDVLPRRILQRMLLTII